MCIICSTLFSQRGDYFIQNYLPKDYQAGTNNFGITQSSDGQIFIANLNGVIIFDGVNWQHCKRKDEIAIQCIAKTTSNKIVVGTEDGDIAIIDKDKNGKYYYASLIGEIPLNNKPQQIIRQILVSGESTYFLSSDKLIEYKNSEFKVFNPTESFHTRAFLMGKHLFVTDLNNAINVLDNGVLKPISGTENLAKEKAFYCYKLNKNTFAIGYRNIGTCIVHYDSLTPNKSTFELKTTNCDQELLLAEINNGCLLSNGNFIVTTNKKGAFELDKDLNIVNKFNTKNGIYDDNVKSAFQDLNGNLWLSLYYGIAFIEINSKILKYDRSNNILGIVSSSTYFEDKLYLATDKGIEYYNKKEEKFMVFDNFNKQSWNLLNYNKKLFICTDKGFYVFFNNVIKQINETKTNYILNDPNEPDIIYCATEDGVEVYKVSANNVTYIKSYSLKSSIKSIACDQYKNIYFASENNGIYFLNYNNSYRLDSIMEKDGLPHQNYENCVFTYNNRLLIGTDDGIYTIKKQNSTKFTCIKDPVFWSLTKNNQVFRGTQLGKDLICTQKFTLKENDKTIETVSYFELQNNSFKLNSGILNRLKNVTPTLITFDSLNNTVFFCANEGLFLLNNTKKLNTNKNYNLILREFKTNADTLLENYIGENEFQKTSLIIPYKNNDISIRIGFTSYENSDFEFCHMLDGKDKNFSPWNKETKLIFNNLREGDYNLIIRAKTELSDKQFELKIPFTILPPWYRSVLAYVIYMIIFILFLVLIIKLNSKRLIAQNLKLEGVIKQRTTIIENQVVLLEHQKKEIIDSINYAQRIQRALLASKLLLDSSLKNSTLNRDYFIFFQPKDIVSGDFYWATKLTNSNFTIAIADSTGHGVPGAIMSMLNISCLKEAVIAQKLDQPNKILNHTRSKIIETLANDGSTEGGKDGMDCSLLSFNLSTNILTYSAANNPIWIVKNNSELIELKADKMPVGKHDRDTISFTQQTIQLQKGDVVYASTDGMPDQFGGPKGKKFMYKHLKELLLEISNLPMNQQYDVISREFNDWKGELEQVDDVLVFGFKV